ncbi:MAG: hypothetical protein AAGF12_03115 [Myxococcota bacterium]
MDRRFLLPFVFLLSLCLTSGCFAITDLDRFQVEDRCLDADLTQRRTFNGIFSGFGEFANRRIEVQLLDFTDPSRPVLLSRAVIAGLSPAEQDAFSVRMFNAVPPGNSDVLRAVIWADVDDDGVFTPGTDPARRTEICPSGLVEFTNDNVDIDLTDPPSVDPMGTFLYSLVDFSAHVNELLELALIDDSSGAVVGYFRLPAVIEQDFSIEIPNIVNQGQTYTVEFYADDNVDGVYTTSPDDHSWIEQYTADANGIEELFSHNFEFADLTVF